MLFNVNGTGQYFASDWEKRKRQIDILSSVKRGNLITVKKECIKRSYRTPQGSMDLCHESRQIQIERFTEWLMDFIKFVHATEDQVILVMGGHQSHTRNLEVIFAAKKYFVSIVYQPPYCTNQIQSLDLFRCIMRNQLTKNG